MLKMIIVGGMIAAVAAVAVAVRMYGMSYRDYTLTRVEKDPESGETQVLTHRIVSDGIVVSEGKAFFRLDGKPAGYPLQGRKLEIR